MSKQNRLFRQIIALGAVILASAAVSLAAGPRFKVTIDGSLVQGDRAVSGRLLIFMTAEKKPLNTIEPDFTDPNAVFITGVEVANLDPRKPIEIDPDQFAFPRKFSEAPAGEYQVMALLDQNHSYTYGGAGPGDITSAVVKAKMPASEVKLTLSQMSVTRPAEYPDNVKIIDFESPMLSAFWGRPVKMQASVVLPPGYDKSKTRRYPVVYAIHGYGGTHLSGLRGVPGIMKEMTDGKWPEMIYVYLNANCSLGHHVFADSVNNGPWGTALVSELIPYLEKQYRMDAKPSGRFLNGHSSGGWSTLWVMITHPDFFGGTWSTSPDPVDFHNFTGPDITKYPPNNAYSKPGGGDYNLVRMDGKELMSLHEYARQEEVLGDFGGQMASFDAVFSPKGPDGRPMQLFDRETGRIDPFVQKAWEKYDIAKVLKANWKTLGPKLKGKLHIVVGTADTFHLDEAVRLLDAELKTLGSDAKIEYLSGKTHFNLYDGGLAERFANEMYQAARPGGKPKTTAK